MSVLNQSGEEQVECPLCMEPLEVDDLNFYPCTCGYQICRFCWNRIREGENGLCPACRKAYPEDPADFTPLSQEQVAAIKTEKKAREQKRRNKTLESRRALVNVRVVQNNLVFVVGLPVRLADPEILKRPEYFGKYGKIHKVVINQSPSYAGSQGPSASAYVTYVSAADALRAIQGVNSATLDGRALKGSLGTTKYCANFMKNQPCPKPDCMYLHELGDPGASFTREDMHANLHQAYERRLHHQLLAQDAKNQGNGTTNGEKSNTKDGSQTNFIPTSVVTSPNINVVNSSRSKKDSTSGGGGGGSGGGSSGGGSSASSTSGGHSGKDAWPSLGTSPPADDNMHKPTVKSQENGTSESSSPTQSQQQSAQTNKTSKDNHTENNNNNKNNRNNTNQKKKQNDTKSKDNNSISQDLTENTDSQQPQNSIFESEPDNFTTNDIDDLDSDRHSLLENHDLLDNSKHSLLDDDSAHSLLNDVNKEVLLLQRQNEMLASMDSQQPARHQSALVNGYGLLDRDSMYMGDRGVSQIDKEIMMRRNEILMRNEMLARQHVMDPKHYLPGTSIGIESANELLGANYHPNHNMLPTFGMRVDNSMGGNGLGAPMSNPLANNMSNMNPMGSMAGTMGSMASNMGSSLGNPMANGLANAMPTPMSPFMMHNQQMMQNQQMQHTGLMNGFDAPQNTSETRYLAENMDKFFTDFRQAQQMRLLLGRGGGGGASSAPAPPTMLNADRLETHHKQSRMVGGGVMGRAGGDGDDDLDFDPIKETQKALAELMESEMHQAPKSTRIAPPGFAPQQHNMHPGGFNRNSAVFSDWTQMDPAIMSTCVPKPPQMAPQLVPQHPPQMAPQQHPHSAHDLFARFNQLQMNPINGAKGVVGGVGLGGVGLGGVVPAGGGAAAGAGGGWAGGRWAGVTLPPGFAPPQSAPECIDAK